MSPARINEEAIIMWENLGRTLAEYPHLAGDQIAANITIEGLEHVEAVRASGKSALFISGHIGNWEIIPKALSMASLPVHVVYRSPNNPYLTQLLDHTRSAYALGHYNKGNEGARGVVAAIKANEPIAMLIDQKENNGALIPFLEAPAMTMLSAAKMAIKYGVPLIPIRIIRTQGVHFKAIISAPLSLANDEIAIMHQLNDLLSAWIREIPSQWFWVHKRWPKEGNA